MSLVLKAELETGASARGGQQRPFRQPQEPVVLPPDTPRQLLAKVIGNANAKIEALGQATEAADRARELVVQAHASVADAKAKGARARTQRERQMIEAARSQAHASAPGTQVDTRAAEMEAQDQLDAAEAALRVLEAAMANSEGEVERARMRVKAAADTLLWSQALPLLEKAKALQAELIETRVVLRYLLHNLKPHEVSVRNPTDEVAKDVRDYLRSASELPSTYGRVAFTDWDSHPASVPWREARRALPEDAEAPLPQH